MKINRSLTLISATLIAGSLSAGVLAQETHYEKHHQYADKFGDFLDSHPSMEEQLSKNPRLVDDKAYMKSNPELRDYLKHHPAVREQFKSHPDHFFHRTQKTQS